jgi:hypothetical protein
MAMTAAYAISGNRANDFGIDTPPRVLVKIQIGS